MDESGIKALLIKYKYPVIMLVVAAAFLLFPSKTDEKEYSSEPDLYFQQMLGLSQGVGRAMVVISENGVVVSCDGASDAKVRLDIIQAVSSYTGFGSDKITILKMEN